MSSHRTFRSARFPAAFAMAVIACGEVVPQEAATTSGDPSTAWAAGNLEEEPQAPCPPCESPDGRPPLGDFNGDGISDILWRHSLTGEMRVWLMNRYNPNTCSAEIVLAPPTPDPGWKIRGTGDFDGDGDADILWQNDTSHKVVIWIMTGTSHTGGGFVDCGLAYWPDWRIAGTGDFNADAKSDILWQRVADPRDLVVWYMNGSTCTAFAELTPGPAGNWNAYGGGYFDDGTRGVVRGTDILWRNSDSGRVVIWYMDKFTHIDGAFTIPDGSEFCNQDIVGIGRYALDNYCSDILWRSNTTGSLWIWQMTGRSLTSIVPVHGCSAIDMDPAWMVVGPH